MYVYYYYYQICSVESFSFRGRTVSNQSVGRQVESFLLAVSVKYTSWKCDKVILIESEKWYIKVWAWEERSKHSSPASPSGRRSNAIFAVQCVIPNNRWFVFDEAREDVIEEFEGTGSFLRHYAGYRVFCLYLCFVETKSWATYLCSELRNKLSPFPAVWGNTWDESTMARVIWNTV